MKYEYKFPIEAKQWNEDGDHPAVIRSYNSGAYDPEGTPWINSPISGGGYRVRPGDYILKNVLGEFYPVSEAVFQSTFKVAE